MEMIVKTMAGFEELLVKELEELGATHIEILKRAVSFHGDQRLMYKANLWLRTGIRILKPIFSFKVKNEYELYESIKNIDWSEYLDENKTFAVNASTQSAKLSHSHYLSLKTKDAIVDQFRERTGKRPSVDLDNPHLRLYLHIDSLNECTISLDSSGHGLHRRGYRTSGGFAPLNEVLAAGLLLLSGWDKVTPFVDFMCGSGTLLIEATQLALNLAPGRNRQFGFQFWNDYDAELWAEVKEEAKGMEFSNCPPIIGNDIDFKAIKITTQNIAAAKLGQYITVNRGNFMRFEPPAGPGLAIVNPPYDLRLEDDNIGELYGMIGDKLKKDFSGYKAWIISANMAALKQVGLRPSRKIPVFNGQLECKFQRYDMYDGSKKAKKQQQV